jgi:hypothetical protein
MAIIRLGSLSLFKYPEPEALELMTSLYDPAAIVPSTHRLGLGTGI